MKQLRRSVSVVALLMSLSLVTPGCTPVRNPATGETQYTSLSPRDEIQIGREEHPKVLAQFGGAYNDPKLQRYIERIGERLRAVSELKDQTFTFTVLDSEVVNAFALPGGYVYVSRGLLALADNEAEVAGVLGHEIGHVTARHTAQRYDRAQLGQLGAAAATIGGLLLGGETGAQLGQTLGGLGATYYVQGFSREQEFDADKLGIRYLARGGYEPRAMASFLEALEQETRLRARLSGRSERDSTPSWLASHPRTADRVRDAIERSESRPTGGRVDRDGFLNAIDGMIFGDSPSQGFVRGSSFIHPELGFAFDAPDGFRLTNTPGAVLGQGSGGRALMFDMGEARGSSDPARYLTEEWMSKQRLQQVQRFDANGRPGAIGFGRVSINNQPAEAMIAVVQRGGREFYRFVLLRQGGLQRGDVAAYERTLSSIRGLSSAERTQAKPLRIRIHTAQPGDTFESLAARMDVEQGADWLRVLNDTDRRPIRPGEKVKLIVRER